MFEVIRRYRHLKLLKRAGRGQDTSGVDGTKKGSLALECPACPHPGRNMPSTFDEIPEKDRLDLIYKRQLLVHP